jgi:hypothetical protein
MSIKLQIILVVFTLVILSFFINMLRKRKLELKYSLLWLVAIGAVLALSIWPKIIDIMAGFLGVADPMNALFFICIVFLVGICISLTVVVSRLSKRIRTVVQSVAIIEYKTRNITESREKNNKIE